MLGGIRGVAITLVACAAVCGTACGGSDDATTNSDTLEFAMASEPPKTFANRLGTLLATTTKRKECAQLDAISVRSVHRLTCPPPRTLRESMDSFQVIGAEEYGTGAVIDYRSGAARDGATILLFVAPDRNWAVSRFGMLTAPSTGTDDDESRDGFRHAVKRYLAAIESRDCKAFADVSFKTEGTTAEDICESFPGTKEFAKRLKANPSAKLKYQGGNSTFGFFTFETQKPTPMNLTFSVLRARRGAPENYVVVDAGESPTAAQHRQAIKALEESRRKNADQSGSMTPTTITEDR